MKSHRYVGFSALLTKNVARKEYYIWTYDIFKSLRVHSLRYSEAFIGAEEA